MSEEDANAAVIRPMRQLYPAPRHLRADEDALEAMLASYRRALARFERPLLELAWQRVVERQNYWCWPKLGEIVVAAEQAQRQLDPGGRQVEAWVERATQLSDDYTRRFMKSAAASRAREGGYEPQLRAYVVASAWVQSQMIGGREGVGYDHYAIFGKGPRDRESEQDWFSRQREQAATGEIRVRVPPAMLKRWAAEAEQGRSR